MKSPKKPTKYYVIGLIFLSLVAINVE